MTTSTPLPNAVATPSPAAADPVAAYRRADARLDALIQPSAATRDVSQAAIRARAERRLDRLRRFLAYLGDPHRRYPIVHVGGTSGKGSTAVAIAGILDAAGHRAGLHTSPYLQVATEKLQLGGRLVAGEDLAALADDVLDAAETFASEETSGPLSYGEVWFALTALWFAREAVDVAVVEVGAGGRFDLTNVVTPAVSVITSVGLDHTETLGRTIPEIAWHKAGIVKAGAPVVTAVADPDAFAAIAAEANAVGSTVERVLPDETFDVLGVDAAGTRWREKRRTPPDASPFVTALPGRFQATNAATAVAAVRRLAADGFAADDAAIQRGLFAARLPGRTETMPRRERPRVVLDGAHNPQKMAALLATLPAVFGAPTALPPVVLFGALGGKDVGEMLRLLAPHAGALVATSAAVTGKASADPATIETAARRAGFGGEVASEAEASSALDAALALADVRGGDLLVTGSLYLVGAVRARWYADDAIVRQRTPWPADDAGNHPLAEPG